MGKKILIVDDSATVRQQVSLALSGAGFAILEAVDGVDGASKLTSDGSIGLVICDVNMPRMNGLEMLEKVRGEGVGVPVLMLTTEGDPALVARAKSAGAKGWIVKPFNPAALVAAAKKLCA